MTVQTATEHTSPPPQRQASKELDEGDGCCLAKIFLSNLISFATRSRRKPEQSERTAGGGSAKRPGVVSLSQVSLLRGARKSPSTDFGVCDSIDDIMLNRLTMLPSEMDPNEWLATHTLILFDHVNALCGTVSELCTPITCPIMCYPGTQKAQWLDDRGKRHLYSAGQYIDCAMSFCEQTSKNEELFPTKHGCQFSPDLSSQCRRVLRLLWHCIGHLYTAHWDALGTLQLRSQFSLVLAHMQRLATAQQLLESKELAALSHTVQIVRPNTSQITMAMLKSRKTGGGGGGCSTMRWSRVPASKSGSWGGHPTPSVLESYKPCAQTC